MRKQIVAVLASILFGAGVVLALPGCATIKSDAKAVEVEIKADLSACGSVLAEDVHAIMPNVADYAVCMAMNKADSSQCSVQLSALKQAGSKDAIACGLAMVVKADLDAHKAAGIDAGQ